MNSGPAKNLSPVPISSTLHPHRVRSLLRAEGAALIVGVAATVIQRGLMTAQKTQLLRWELGLIAFIAMLVLVVNLLIRYRLSLARNSFLRENRTAAVLSLLWVIGMLLLLIFRSLLVGADGRELSRSAVLLGWTELFLIARGVAGVVLGTRNLAAGGANPALILVSSFAGLILAGTLLLMLPRARADAGATDEQFGRRLQTALFTATSASCVTGLVVVPTGGSNAYWSPTGQAIILMMFQIGGLGIMTCGAFFAVLAGRHMPIRESATLGEILESDRLGDVRRLVFAILGFTIMAELIGALLLSGLWSDRESGQQAFYSLFHAVSAFCNAGFSLTDNSFVGMGTRWQIWGVASGLIIVGGLGFSVLYNLVLAVKTRFGTIRKPPLFNLPGDRVWLSVTAKIVLVTTLLLLLAGAVGYEVLQSTGPRAEITPSERLCDAWFQSVTFRTAGFNTVDFAKLQPATKLYGILLMFVGASPGSTGGGVKTVCFALVVLALLSILRGRQRVEIAGRTIPDVLVNRALTIISLGMMVVMVTTLLLVLFENRPDLFLDHLFEATSAFGTVGLSTSIEVIPGEFVTTTQSLSVPSRMVIIVTMFLGRVGPLTLLIALAGRMKEARYDYPIERVTLG